MSHPYRNRACRQARDKVIQSLCGSSTAYSTVNDATDNASSQPVVATAGANFAADPLPLAIGPSAGSFSGPAHDRPVPQLVAGPFGERRLHRVLAAGPDARDAVSAFASSGQPVAWALAGYVPVTHCSKNHIIRSPSARASSIGGGPAPQAQSSAAPHKLTIRVRINRNAEAVHDTANLAK